MADPLEPKAPSPNYRYLPNPLTRKAIRRLLDLQKEVERDPEKARFLPPPITSEADLHRWYKEWTTPVQTIPFPEISSERLLQDTKRELERLRADQRNLKELKKIQNSLKDNLKEQRQLQDSIRQPAASSAPPPVRDHFAEIEERETQNTSIQTNDSETPHWFETGIGDARLWGFVTVISLAIAFSRRSANSDLATWAFLIAGAVLALLIINTHRRIRASGYRSLATGLALLLLVPSAIASGRWLTTSPPAIPQQELKRKSTTDSSVQPSSVLPANGEERVFIDIPPEQLAGYYKKYNTVQADDVVKTHIGKWVKVSGKVVDVDREKGYFGAPDSVAVSMAIEGENGLTLFIVSAWFHQQRWMDRAQVLLREEKVTIVGKLKRMSEASIQLDQCEIVE